MTPKNDAPATGKFFRTWRYILFWISSLFSNMGTWMQQIAQPWVVLSLSNSPFWVGLDSFALNVPGLLFTIAGGVLADRFDRRRLVLILQLMQFACVLLLVALLATGALQVWMIVCISFFVGLTDSLSNPSFQTIIPSLVPAEDIPRAVSLNSTQFNLSRILGPAIAGVIIVKFGAVVCFSANAASYFPFLLSVWFIYPRKQKQPAQQTEVIQQKPIEQLAEITRLLRIPHISLPLMITFITNLFCGPLVTFCPVLIKNVFHAQVGNFGWAMAAFGCGGLLGAGVSFIPLPKQFARNRLAAVAAIILALTVVAIAFNRSLVLLSVLLVCAGAALTVANISVNTFLQQNATNINRGRVASLYQLALYGGISLGGLLTGFVVARLSITTALMINGGIAAVLQLLLFGRQLMQPDVRKV